MNIYLQTQGFDLTPAIDAHVRQQLAHNLTVSEDHITAVDVFLGDVNGPKGGVDKKALVCVRLASRLAVRFEAVHSDLYAAIAVAARKARHAVNRTMRKHQRMQRSQLRELRRLPGELQVG